MAGRSSPAAQSTAKSVRDCAFLCFVCRPQPLILLFAEEYCDEAALIDSLTNGCVHFAWVGGAGGLLEQEWHSALSRRGKTHGGRTARPRRHDYPRARWLPRTGNSPLGSS